MALKGESPKYQMNTNHSDPNLYFSVYTRKKRRVQLFPADRMIHSPPIPVLPLCSSLGANCNMAMGNSTRDEP
jgi:hypothetical protein